MDGEEEGVTTNSQIGRLCYKTKFRGVLIFSKGKKKEGELQCCCRCFDGRKKQGVIGFHAHATSL